MTSSYSESKLILFLRTILSFLLAISISVVGVAFCFSTNFLNSTKIEKCFTDYSYIYRRYRSVSAVSISFLTAGFFEIFLAGIVLIISNLKKFDIYPVYLSDSFMHYFYTCILAVVVTGLLFIVISLAVSTLAWINKSKIKG